MRRNWIGLFVILSCVGGIASCATMSQEVDEFDPLIQEPVVVSKNQEESMRLAPLPLTTPSAITPVAPESAFEEVIVEEIVDGDTMKVRCADGHIERVRVNTIDAAEIGYPYWLMPTLRAEELVLDKTVWLETEDVDSQPYFRKGKRRLLRDVHVRLNDGTFALLSEILVDEGLVWVSPMPQSKRQLKERPLNRKYLQRLLDAEERARDAHRGIWHGSTPKTTRSDNSVGPRFTFVLTVFLWYSLRIEIISKTSPSPQRRGNVTYVSRIF